MQICPQNPLFLPFEPAIQSTCRITSVQSVKLSVFRINHFRVALRIPPVSASKYPRETPKSISEHYRNIIGTLSEHKRDLPERKKHPKTIRADSIPHIIELSKTRIGLLAADIPILQTRLCKIKKIGRIRLKSSSWYCIVHKKAVPLPQISKKTKEGGCGNRWLHINY